MTKRVVSVYLDPDDYTLLAEICAKFKVKQSDFIRRVLVPLLQAWRHAKQSVMLATLPDPDPKTVALLSGEMRPGVNIIVQSKNGESEK